MLHFLNLKRGIKCENYMFDDCVFTISKITFISTYSCFTPYQTTLELTFLLQLLPESFLKTAPRFEK